MDDAKNRRAEVEAEAALWLARHDAGEADPEAFARWRDADPRHAAAYVQLDAAWARVDRARALRAPGPPNADLLASDEVLPTRRRLLRAAAVGGLMLAGAAGGLVVFGGRASAETATGERRSMRLPDGTLLDLNTDSRASWRFTDNQRRVWLERGEAALEIGVADPRPFVLAAGGQAIALEPGVFNARLRDDSAEITVLRGAADLGAAAVSEGGVVAISGGTSDVRVLAPADMDAAIAWRRGEIIFDGDRLADAVAEYNRYLTDKIVIADEAIMDIELGGRFTTHDPQEFLSALEQAFPIEVARGADGSVFLSRAAQL